MRRALVFSLLGLSLASLAASLAIALVAMLPKGALGLALGPLAILAYVLLMLALLAAVLPLLGLTNLKDAR